VRQKQGVQTELQQRRSLHARVRIGRGARIMINHNTALDWGLLNGATGTVYDVIYEPLPKRMGAGAFGARPWVPSRGKRV
jgi:hypothetical protein